MHHESATATVTFLFTDIEGSTTRWERDRRAMALALERHDAISAASIQRAGGNLFKSTGDGVCAAFADPAAAVAAAIDLRRRLEDETWPASVGPIRVRAAVHAGPAEARDEDYFGPTVNRAARLMAAGHGGQILISEPVRLLLGDTISTRDLGEHRLRDLLRPERIHQVGDIGEDHPPLRTLDARTNNLPVQATPFVGRDQTLLELGDLVRKSRLVTLTGPGGTGKTRLALQAGAELSEDFAATYFVGLASITGGDTVGQAVVDTIGVRGQAGDDPIALLREHSAGRPTLLILDNFEHLMDAAPWVGSLLESTTDITVVATSRELLRLRAERHFPVAPLDTPHSIDLPTAELAGYEAVRLFVERAQAIRPDFTLDETTANDVAEICRRLDGLPLALELAAARVRLFNPARLRSALESSLDVLRGGPVDAPDRHQTLVDTIQWSYDLLDDQERRLFRRLAVLVGGRSLEALERVCLPGLDLDPITAAESLADKSLIRVEQGRSGEPRLVMLETLHAFALRRLEEHGEFEDMARRHAEFFADLSVRAEAELRGRNQAVWMARLDDDYANLETARARSFGGSDPAAGMRIVGALRDYWFYQGRYPDMGRWADTAVARLTDEDAAVAAGVYLTAGFHAYGVYRRDALELIDRAIALYEAAGDDAHRALAIIWAAGAAEMLGDKQKSRALIEEGLELASSAGATSIVGQALNMWGEMERLSGNLELARDIQEQGLQVALGTGEQRRVAMIKHNLGLIAHHLGDDDTANRLIRESLEVAAELESSVQISHSLIALSEQIALRGDPHIAVRLIGAAFAHFDEVGLELQPSDAPDYDRIRNALREMLGSEVYDKELAEGARLDLNAAVELARRS